MKKILVILAFLITGFGADAASPRVGGITTARSGQSSITSARTARSATVSRSVQPTQTTTRGRAATTATTATPGIVSRAAKQNVISTGTKVATATQNTVVDEKCWNGFMGCMDSFCMLDNVNGGRCTCSDKNAEYDSILAEIQSLDEQSYKMATFGVEQIEMGDAAKAVADKTDSITKRIEADSAKSKRESLDLSAWNINEVDFDADVEDIFSLSSDGTGITNKTGDALYRAAAKLCNAQLPECKSQSTMMELMYKQRVRSDCTAYENSLRQQRTQSAQKLASAQSAMREAALEQYRNANKYDLGQCTVQFKQCMQTTGGCGDDFTGCVEYAVRDSLVKANSKSKSKEKTIKGSSSKITLLASTYEALESKKELCMSVTQQCVNVRDQVWDTFLREVAPQVKSAELIVESNKRTSCISTISNCFQKACKENMDPNDPDGSYDMCLTRPETLRSACKVEIDPCEGAIPNIMEYVTARLASMRVDSCTKEFKECLTSEDRCGADYTQCVGLDTDTIVKMCPRDKLVGCYNSKKPEQDVYTELAEVATGIFLNIDNNMLTACQRALDTSMIRVCGSTTNCDELVSDGLMGARSLKYEICTGEGTTQKCYATADAIPNALFGDSSTVWNMSITGEIPWADLTYNATSHAFTIPENINENSLTEINALSRAVYNAIETIKADKTVDDCLNGRDNKWRGQTGDASTASKRFPNLTGQIEQLIRASVLGAAYENYKTKYDELSQQKMKDSVKIAGRIDRNEAIAAARTECEKWHSTSELTADMIAGATPDLSQVNISDLIDLISQTESHAQFNEGTGECIITTRSRKCEIGTWMNCSQYSDWTTETTTIKLLD